jgi:hypothetical protein
MKSFNLNVAQLVSTLIQSGDLTVDELNTAIEEQRGTNKPCGFAADFHGHNYTLFVATDKETQKVTRSKDGVRVKINLRAQVAKKDQEAQTPGKVLPQGVQGAPVLPDQILAGLAALGLEVRPAAAPQEPETSFASLNAPTKL